MRPVVLVSPLLAARESGGALAGRYRRLHNRRDGKKGRVARTERGAALDEERGPDGECTFSEAASLQSVPLGTSPVEKCRGVKDSSGVSAEFLGEAD
jgi:hypothetical protein